MGDILFLMLLLMCLPLVVYGAMIVFGAVMFVIDLVLEIILSK